jgi:hypothetical protein
VLEGFAPPMASAKHVELLLPNAMRELNAGK